MYFSFFFFFFIVRSRSSCCTSIVLVNFDRTKKSVERADLKCISALTTKMARPVSIASLAASAFVLLASAFLCVLPGVHGAIDCNTEGPINLEQFYFCSHSGDIDLIVEEADRPLALDLSAGHSAGSIAVTFVCDLPCHRSASVHVGGCVVPVQIILSSQGLCL